MTDVRSAVVTGGTSGIGAATTEELRRRGVRVIVWDRSAGSDVTCDVTSEEAVVTAAAETVRLLGGPPDAVVCAAGVTGRGLLTELSAERWDAVMAVNLRGAFLVLRELASSMINANQDGSFVLVSSTSAGRADPGIGAYAISKAGLDHLARVAALELGPHGIRVNSLAPGATETPMLAGNLADVAYRKAVVETTPLRGIALPSMIAKSIVNLLHEEWVTGQVLTVDGGASLVTSRGAARLAVQQRTVCS